MKLLTGTPMQQRLYETFAEMLKTKQVSEISVVALTKQAGVSRGTFYMYYADIPHFVDQLERTLFMHLGRAHADNLQTAIKATALAPNPEIAYPIFEKLMATINDYYPLFRGLSGPNGDPHFWKMFETEMTSSLFSALPETLENTLYLDDIPVDYVMPIFMSSILTIIRHWLLKINPEPYQEVAKIITESRYVEPYNLFKASDE
ncbi:hypothetical protein AYR62_08525 [Secundilactobacillus paracollinoides]|uniref:HTH tetR-type domain-containing protein n=1 Tax=Secundilactobacillus paracollinoides TaxID=240427 RepID=A0A1B2IZC5_9LACO|nr:TetR/AcrR family transcriptional regulator [Secundilactobacillus paracollinoides]ANZ61495.1 hypothetical protein AYR61_09100 [Secundilactobacillus paracollinoides]ANZ64115.1 hypothetical protein AYR62_08525 [Secundilactobacillus paracollinoides]ANZ67416.1 hypothetical protein AYR63_09850 [Secundilactobacillus paracollinoides]KRL77478.1 transcription regulator [Secundilactobacillus paracollinoides DSM 15502 = JCM 11969]